MKQTKLMVLSKARSLQHQYITKALISPCWPNSQNIQCQSSTNIKGKIYAKTINANSNSLKVLSKSKINKISTKIECELWCGRKKIRFLTIKQILVHIGHRSEMSLRTSHETALRHLHSASLACYIPGKHHFIMFRIQIEPNPPNSCPIHCPAPCSLPYCLTFFEFD